MEKGRSFSLLIFIVCLYFGSIQTDTLLSKEKEMTAEQVVAAHVKSLGPGDVLAGIKTRGIKGQSTINFIQGGTGKMAGQAVIVSAGVNMAIKLAYAGIEYPGEYFTYNGTEVAVRNISPGQRSPLGDFIYRYNQMMKEGLIGGVYSLGWPLLDLEKKKPSFKYNRIKIEGQELYELEYIAKTGMNDIKVKLYFDPATFHHVRTEYRLKIRGEQALINGKTVTRGAADSGQMAGGGGGGPITRAAGIQDAIRDSNYLLIEKFEDFKEIDKMTLPQRYAIEYSIDGEGSSFLANWTIQAEKFVHNAKIDAAFMNTP